jgi:hypothetical protein
VLSLVAATLSSASTGCYAVYSTRPVDVIVTRTDNGEPAAGVPVKVFYLAMFVGNVPRDVEGTTDATGRVTLPMADFRDGPYLDAGRTRFAVESDTVRHGGSLTYKPSANLEEPIPTYSVRLVPRQQSLINRLLGYRDEQHVGGTPPP